jgi:TOMM system kinase/cyclase fusion protein
MPGAHEPTLAVGGVFQGAYEVLARLGGGSFGAVYKARQLSTGQEVAIKVLRMLAGDTAADAANQIERFRREMRLCAGLSHPNIVRLTDSGEAEGGVLYAVFEHVPGPTLREALAVEGKLDLPETVHLMTQVLDALSCAHAHGVVHRDLKPENIMLTHTGARRNALVLDFGLGGLTQDAERWGLSRITATHEMLGTPCYAAPEQLRGEAPTTRSDLYSWGLIFLECLTGELAVGGGSGQDVILKQLGPEPVPIPPWLRTHRLGPLLEIVTAKAVEKRDVTIEGLLGALSYIALGAMTAATERAHGAGLPEGERRQLTIVSCRFTLTPFGSADLDLEEVDEVLHAQHAIVAEHAARAGGQVAGVLADRLLLVFGYPAAREDDVRRAARAARTIAAEAVRTAADLATAGRLRLEVRIGVHTGMVVVREVRQATYQGLYDLVGVTPQVAVRLDELAAPGEVLVSADTDRMLRGEMRSESAGVLRLWEGGRVMPVLRLTGDGGGQEAETSSWTRETPLAGRAVQLGQLLGTWRQVEGGRPGAVLLSGEPGIGKSRLVRELRRRVTPNAWLEGRCAAEHQASPLRPIIDILLAVRQPIDALLARYGFDVDQTLPLLAALLRLPYGDGSALAQLTAERRKDVTLRAIVELILRMAQEQPVVLAVEDLHWADPTTLELVGLLVEEVRTAQAVATDPAPRVCVVFTARPEFAPPWSLEGFVLISLQRLGRADVEEMVGAGLATGRTLPKALLDQIVQASDGVPLFIEEVTRVLLEVGEAAFSEARDGTGVSIPATLRDLLTARLDRLSRSARETVQLAAVLGREFRYEVLSAVSQVREEMVLRNDVREVLDAGLLLARRSVRGERYVFKHALMREAAYESMTRLRRQGMHQRVARTLHQRFPEVEQHQPELLAQHYERAGEVESAVEYWHFAGERSVQRATYAEAIQQLEHGLTLLEGLATSPARSRREVELLTTLGTAFISTRGYGAEEVERTFARASRLCHSLGADVPIKVLVGIVGVHVTRGDREAAEPFLPQLRRLAEHSDPVAAMAGRQLLGIYAFWCGDFRTAYEHTIAGMRLYATDEVQHFAWDYGAGLLCHAYAMSSLFQLGYPDQAAALSRDMATIGERSGNPWSLAVALAFSATLSHERGEPGDTLALSNRLRALAAEQRNHLWMANALSSSGSAKLQLGEIEAASADIRQALDLFRAVGMSCSYSYYLTYLADAYREGGRIGEGLVAVEDGLDLCERLFGRFHAPELWRLRGELLGCQGQVHAGEAALRRALDLARQQHGKSFELRAAMSLGRLLRELGRRDEARSLVAEVYGWFTEGFATRDLRQARALLAELGGDPGAAAAPDPTASPAR